MTTASLHLPLAGDFQARNSLDHAQALGPHRFVSIAGKRGWQPLSRKSGLKLPSSQHLKEHGSFVLWLCPTETLTVSPPLQHVQDKNPIWQEYGLLHDVPPGGAPADSIFAWYWRSYWHPQMVAKFMHGTAGGGGTADFGVTPYVPVEHMGLIEHQWYQLVFTFDKPASQLCIYINGILCGTTRYPFQAETPRPELYLGNPAMVFADVAVYDKALSSDEVQALLRDAEVRPDPALQDSLRQLYTVQPKPAVDWTAGPDWTLALDNPLTRAGDFDGWTQQGCLQPPYEMVEKSITDEGLLLQTPAKIDIETRVYFWSPQVFEGDLAVEYEFRPEKDTGLALLVLQAAGMQCEDFWTDHPPRTTGAMDTIIGDEVKNYHWEYFRHAVDVRNDLGTHVLVKNPWCKPMAMSTTTLLTPHQWHKLLFVQEGSRLRCAVDGQWVADVQDDGAQHCGPVLRAGRIGLRLMYDTRMRFRHLRVWNRNPIVVLSKAA